MGATLARSAAIGQRAIAISAGPPLRRGALRGAHWNPGRARALAWNRVCGAIGFESSSGYAIVGGEPQLARSYDGELNTITGEPIVHSMVVYYGRQRKKPKVGMF